MLLRIGLFNRGLCLFVFAICTFDTWMGVWFRRRRVGCARRRKIIRLILIYYVRLSVRHYNSLQPTGFIISPVAFDMLQTCMRQQNPVVNIWCLSPFNYCLWQIHVVYRQRLFFMVLLLSTFGNKSWVEKDFTERKIQQRNILLRRKLVGG